MDPRREALLLGYLEAWNAHDPAAIASFFADDGVYTDQTTASEARGASEIEAFVQRTLIAFPDLRFDLVRVADGDGFALAEWTCTASHLGPLYGLPATGRRISNSGVDIADLNPDNQIKRLVSHYDKVKILYDLGLLPQIGGRVERVTLAVLSSLGKLIGATKARSLRPFFNDQPND